MKRYAKQTALALAMALTVTSLAPATASAATKPSFKKKLSTVKKGKSYTYTVKNIKKGTKVKWTITKGLKTYVSFKKTSNKYSETTKAGKKKTTVSNKIYVRKNAAKAKKGYIKVSVTGKNGKKYTFSDKITVAKKKTTPATTTPATKAPATETPATKAPVTEAPATTGPATEVPATTAPVTTAPATKAPVTDAPVTEVPATVAPTTPVETVAPTATTTVAPTEAPAVSAAAVTATALNAKTIAVTFNRDLTKEEQDGVKVSVTREKATQSVKTAFKDAKTLYITRDADVEFAAATYTVALTGTVEKAFDVTVEAPVAKALTITSKVLVDESVAAAVNVSLVDQYGAEITLKADEFSVVINNKTEAARTPKFKIENGKFTIDTKTTAVNKDDEIQVTLLHKTTGLSATATLKVVESTYVSKITLGDIELPAGSARLTKNTKGVKIYYTAVNNYDETVDLKDVAGEFQIVSTNEGVLKPANVTAKYDSTTKKTYFEISEFDSVGKTTLVVLANKSGETTKIDLDVLENAGEVYAAEFESTSVEVAKGGSVAIPVKLTDRYGDLVAAKNAGIDAISCVASNQDAIVAVLDTDEASKNYGKLVVNTLAGAKEDSTVILTATVNGKPTVISVKIGKTAVPSTIAVKADTTSLVTDAVAEIKFDVKDQYGNSVSDDAFVAAGYSISVTSKAADYVATGAAVAAIVPGTTVTAAAVKADATATTKNVTVDLRNNKGDVVDTKTVTFTIEPNTASNLTYTVKEIPTLYKNDSNVATAGAVGAYAKEVVITAKKSNGTDVKIPASKILSVTSDSKNVIVDKDAAGKWYVAGKDSATTITADVTAKLTVVVATDDGSTIATTEVKVSKDGLQYNALKLYDDVTKSDKKEISAFDVERTAVVDKTLTVALDDLVKVDQFGVETAVTKADAVSLSSFTNVTANSTATFKDNTLTITNVDNLKDDENASFKVTLVDGALAKTVTVTIKK